jgi:hypothetical protein
VVVDGLKHFAVSSYADCEKLLEEGLANRTVGSTAMNASSSRSHCVFTLELQQLEGTQARSKITLIDLAGSEKTQTAKTEGQMLVEGININKSLSCLGQCIAGLAKAAAKRDMEEVCIHMLPSTHIHISLFALLLSLFLTHKHIKSKHPHPNTK